MEVQEPYLKVKTNKGVPGVYKVTLAESESNLKTTESQARKVLEAIGRRMGQVG